ncbi:MAG: hypothetical protein J7L82_05740 [Staphylothermus sp.]|nr:hypothetical protein [Staphylothermus sp.]
MLKEIIVIGIVLLGMFGAYLFLFPDAITIKDGSIEVNIGETKTWTNNDFYKVAENPEDYVGDKVSLEGVYFNSINMSGEPDVIGLEVFMGTADEYQSNPYDTSKRIFVLAPRDVGENLEYYTCLHVEGTIGGEATVTTMDGSVFHHVYIENRDISEQIVHSNKISSFITS